MSQVETEIEVRKLAKRMQKLSSELELAYLDLGAYASPLSKGQFPNSWFKEAYKSISGYMIEMQRIQNRFTELFNPQITAEAEAVTPPPKRRKRK